MLGEKKKKIDMNMYIFMCIYIEREIRCVISKEGKGLFEILEAKMGLVGDDDVDGGAVPVKVGVPPGRRWGCELVAGRVRGRASML